MSETRLFTAASLPRDLIAGVVVFLVALPLCLGIALASNAPLFSGLIAGIVGGIVVGILSKSHTSVSGPAAGLAAIVAAQIVALNSFSTFLLAVVIAGVIQIGMGLARAGFIAEFFPSSVIKGLLAAIGVLLILKQIPHIVGHDTSPEGEMSFQQPDHETTFSAFAEMLPDFHLGSATIGLISVALLIFWDRYQPLKKSLVPAPLVVVLLGVALSQFFHRFGGPWVIGGNHLVQVPIAESLPAFFGNFQFPDFSQWTNPAVYKAGVTIALVASLETLLNLEAIDKLDRRQRVSPPSRELFAQGVGNVVTGMLGGIPITSVIIRSSVNIMAGGQTKLSAIFHGILLAVCVMLFPAWLNMIPLSCLAAILLITGFKLASPTLFRQMWSEGRYQFLPFITTVLAIVFTDLLIGIVIGLCVGLGFILNSNLRRPLHRTREKHVGGEVVRIELANQVSFLNRAALSKAFFEVPEGGHLLLDAQRTDYIDPDILDLIRDFKEKGGPARGVQVSLRGFRQKYKLEDEIQFVDYSTRELQSAISPEQVLQLLKDGQQRFRAGKRLSRDFSRQVVATANSQHPLAVVLSCIDSRSPVELIFDLGVGDVFSVRVAGNVISRKVLGSIEYGCAVGGAKLVLVLGHTGCGAVTTAVQLAASKKNVAEATGCDHVEFVLREIQESCDPDLCRRVNELAPLERNALVDNVAKANVRRTVQQILQRSHTLEQLARAGRIWIIGAIYDIGTGDLAFVTSPESEIR